MTSNTRFIPYQLEKHNLFNWDTILRVHLDIVKPMTLNVRSSYALVVKNEAERELNSIVESWIKNFVFEHIDTLPTEPLEGYENYEIKESYWLTSWRTSSWDQDENRHDFRILEVIAAELNMKLSDLLANMGL